MIVNERKHQAMVLGTKNHEFSFPVDSSIDILGINVGKNLFFTDHISIICKKINNQFNVMSKTLF